MATEKTRVLRVALISGLAGGATLACEVLGARLLRPVVGSTAVAQAGAVAGVLGGLGVGAWFAALSIDRGRVAPRRTVEYSLVFLAFLALAAPRLAGWLTVPCARAIVALAARHASLAGLLQTALALTLTAPAGLAAGAAYPALATLHGHGAGRATAVSGAASSLGAAVAVIVMTFGLAPAIGVRGSMVACAAMYAIAFALSRTFAADDAGGAASEPAPERARSKRARRRQRVAEERSREAAVATSVTAVHAGAAGVPGALALAGFASTVFQLAMGRVGVLAFGPSAFALAAATAAHTISLGAGEAAAAPGVDRTLAPRRALAIVLTASAGFAVLAAVLAPRLPAWSGSLYPGAGPSMTSVWAGAFGLLVLTMLPVVAPLAAAIPLGARIMADAGEPRAGANARALLAMAAGNVAGALAGPLVLVPRISLRGAVLACAAALGLGAIAAAGRAAFARPTGVRNALVAAALLALGGWKAWGAWDATTLSRGPFLYSNAEDLDLGQVIQIRDGRESTVAVRRDPSGAVILQIDGKVDATSGGDAATQILVGVVPTVLARRPRNVLVVGLGSGMTVDAVRDVPGVSRVDVTELLPEVVDAARVHFRGANHAVLDSPRVRVIAQDASLYLRGSRARYDVIVSEPSNPWVAGMADLFTREALEAARDRLEPGGVMAAWFHAHSTDVQSFVSVLATFHSVFPRAAFVEVVAGQDYMVVGMVPPVAVDVDRVVSALASPSLARHLERAGIADRGTFFGRFVAGVDGVAAIARDGEVLAADDLRLEFRAPLLLYNDASADIFALFGRAQDLPLAGLDASGSLYQTVLEESEPTREASLHGRQMSLARARRDYNLAVFEGEQAVAAAPADTAMRTALAHIYLRRAGRRYRTRSDPGGAAEDVRNALELRPPPAVQFRAHLVLGDMALARDGFADAAREYGAALEIARVTESPAPELHVRMAQVLRALGDLRHARAELDRAVRDSSEPQRAREIQRLRDSIGE